MENEAINILSWLLVGMMYKNATEDEISDAIGLTKPALDLNDKTKNILSWLLVGMIYKNATEKDALCKPTPSCSFKVDEGEA